MGYIGFGILLLVLLVVYFFYTRQYEQNYVKCLDTKEHPLKIFYSMILHLLFETRVGNFFQQARGQREQLQALHVGEDIEEKQILYWCKKIALIVFVAVGCVFITVCSYGAALGKEKHIPQTFLLREKAGNGSKKVSLEVSVSDLDKETIEIMVPEQVYTLEQLEEKMEEAKAYVAANYLGENLSEEQVEYPLNLMEYIPDSAIMVAWNIWDEHLVHKDGSLKNAAIATQGEWCQITANLFYGEYSRQLHFQIRVLPKKQWSGEDWKRALQEAVIQAGEENPTGEQMHLPDTVREEPVYYWKPMKETKPVVLILGIVIMVALWIGFDSDLGKKKKARDTQMLVDYPELVHKFTLLLSAGMTISGAWGKIGMEYEKKRRQGEKEKRYAYEEWLFTWKELENGVTQVKALEHFGQRAGLMPYLKFSTMMATNARKGSQGLLELLEYEAMDLFENRKQTTKRIAEEASTKLLLPMIIMLILVMLIIMAPAFLSL